MTSAFKTYLKERRFASDPLTCQILSAQSLYAGFGSSEWSLLIIKKWPTHRMPCSDLVVNAHH